MTILAFKADKPSTITLEAGPSARNPFNTEAALSALGAFVPDAEVVQNGPGSVTVQTAHVLGSGEFETLRQQGYKVSGALGSSREHQVITPTGKTLDI